MTPENNINEQNENLREMNYSPENDIFNQEEHISLDANGNLIGLNFDRVWEGTMSDLYYDPKICRNIMVDVRYILFVIDKYANAKRLINEMKIIK